MKVRIDGEHGDLIRSFDDDDIVNRIPLDGPGTNRCLGFIDPYGHTIFNQIQIPVLLDELRALAPTLQPPFGLRVRDLMDFIAAAQDHPHYYVRFVGE